MKSRKPESFIRQPVYPGGAKAMDDFIKQNLRYPEDALKNKIQGIVSVEIDIDANGKVVASRIKHGIGHGCDEEAVRLVGLLEFEKRKYRGLFVVFHRVINIHFRLHEASVEVKFAYQYKEKEKTKGGNAYTYTITPD